MAAEAYINYDKVMELVDFMEERRDKMEQICDTELLQNRVNDIKANYSGEAAEAFENDVKATTKKVLDEINKLIEDLKKEANTQKEAYESQDTKLAS